MLYYYKLTRLFDYRKGYFLKSPPTIKSTAGVIIVAVVMCHALSFAQDDPGIIDTLRIANIETSPFSHFSVPVDLFNDELLMGLTIPLALAGDSVNISIDSVVFNPERVAGCQFFEAHIDNDHKAALTGIIGSLDADDIFIQPGSGLLMEIYCSVGEVTTEVIDTLRQAPMVPYNTLTLIGDGIIAFEPACIPGFIRITPTGIDDEADLPQNHTLVIKAYPNPFNEQFDLTISGIASEGLNLSIYDIMGRVVYNDFLNIHKGINTIGPIDMQGRPSGIYFIRVISGGQQQIIKTVLLK